jgi:hypothetical protein
MLLWWLLTFTRERREHRVFQALLHMVPGLEEHLVGSLEEEIRMVADLVSLHCPLIG